MSETFTSVDDAALEKAISSARERLVFVAPGIRKSVAEAITKAMDVIPKNAIHIALDVDAEVCRLGYGDIDFKGTELLQLAAARHGITVNHHPGVRIGLLIADQTTLIYSPTPLLIDAESKQSEKPNGILLQNELPSQLANACAVSTEGFAKLEVGRDRVKTDFSPKVFTAYKDVTYQTFKDPKFRTLMENRFGKKDIDRIFSEYDAAPERQRPAVDPNSDRESAGNEPALF